jgi:hypothetical protein
MAWSRDLTDTCDPIVVSVTVNRLTAFKRDATFSSDCVCTYRGRLVLFFHGLGLAPMAGTTTMQTSLVLFV